MENKKNSSLKTAGLSAMELKANELYYKFSKLFADANADYVHEPSKESALIVVDELIGFFEPLFKKAEIKNTFWYQVKEEIKKL